MNNQLTEEGLFCHYGYGTDVGNGGGDGGNECGE
jgi:hypothetical protein